MILKHKSDGITPLCNSLPFPHSCLWHLKTKFLVLAYKPQYSSRCLPFWLRLLLLCTSFMLLPPPTLASYWCCCCFFNTQSSCFKVLACLVLSSPWNTLPPALNMVGSSWHSNLSLQFTSERHSLNTYSKVASHPHLFSMTSLYIMFTIIYLFIDSLTAPLHSTPISFMRAQTLTVLLFYPWWVELCVAYIVDDAQ